MGGSIWLNATRLRECYLQAFWYIPPLGLGTTRGSRYHNNRKITVSFWLGSRYRLRKQGKVHLFVATPMNRNVVCTKMLRDDILYVVVIESFYYQA